MATAVINQQVQDEIARLSQSQNVDANVLEQFANFVIQNYNPKNKRSTPELSITAIKQAVYHHFKVKNTQELKKSGLFRMSTDGMDTLDFRLASTWKMLYRKFVGVLPNEKNQEGYGCINGINIFNYFKPWRVFGLNPKIATKEDIKKAYYNLAKIYHPDNPTTGDRKIFEQIDIMYQSIIEVF
ncbi:MAG TPA: molecular chaperone DnaJ [Planktothrix sp. UBA8407]|nr:molecular chaperone DnaJ [Planktothrix sp. UBA8402]HAO10869.1 molecular chaperone DnaJ [Planktothrix sp. UBA8407]HBK24173.1 molecular chaperone DnaJ [Planktothrix sp. UBA10369]